MKTLILVTVILFQSVLSLKADEVKPVKKVFDKSDILKLVPVYLNSGLNVKNPAIIDVDKDGKFDILNFTSKGNVEYYRNTGTLEAPVFVLENKHFDHYQVNSFLPSGMPLPVFFADKDGDNDLDVFGIVKEKENNYKVVYVENIADIDNYTLITIILVLLIVLLIALIVR